VNVNDTTPVTVNKGDADAGHSSIKRVTYLFHDKYQRTDWWDDKIQVHPETNFAVLEALKLPTCIVYGMGSLYTSILPALIMDGIEDRIAGASCPKFLLLNGWHDKETSWYTKDGNVNAMDAAMFVEAIADALDSSYMRSELFSCSKSLPKISDYVTHILYPKEGEIDVAVDSLDKLCSLRRSAIKSNSISSDVNDEDKSAKNIIQTIQVNSVPADIEGCRSGGKSYHRIFDSKAFVETLKNITKITEK